MNQTFRSTEWITQRNKALVSFVESSSVKDEEVF